MFINLLLGVMSRVAPQLSLFSIGFPITISMGLVLLFISLPWIERPMTQALTQIFTMFGS
jgi:flagellar biosynthetic protein FliR